MLHIKLKLNNMEMYLVNLLNNQFGCLNLARIKRPNIFYGLNN